ncbi:MAG: TlpA disulfide reductase family protein, partial [Verrucomicrobiota bacterium]
SFIGKGVHFLYVNQAESAALVSDFLDKRNWPHHSVAMDIDSQVGTDYQVNSLPQTYVIGKDGKIFWAHSGYNNKFKQNLWTAIMQAQAVELEKE